MDSIHAPCSQTEDSVEHCHHKAVLNSREKEWDDKVWVHSKAQCIFTQAQSQVGRKEVRKISVLERVHQTGESLWNLEQNAEPQEALETRRLSQSMEVSCSLRYEQGGNEGEHPQLRPGKLEQTVKSTQSTEAEGNIGESILNWVQSTHRNIPETKGKLRHPRDKYEHPIATEVYAMEAEGNLNEGPSIEGEREDVKHIEADSDETAQNSCAQML